MEAPTIIEQAIQSEENLLNVIPSYVLTCLKLLFTCVKPLEPYQNFWYLLPFKPP